MQTCKLRFNIFFIIVGYLFRITFLLFCHVWCKRWSGKGSGGMLLIEGEKKVFYLNWKDHCKDCATIKYAVWWNNLTRWQLKKRQILQPIHRFLLFLLSLISMLRWRAQRLSRPHGSRKKGEKQPSGTYFLAARFIISLRGRIWINRCRPRQ